MKKIVLIALLGLLSLFAVVAVALPTILHKAGLHPEYTGPKVEVPQGKRALVITTSHAVLAAPGETEGAPTGVMASEMTHPYYTFLDAGIDVDVASIKGGEIPVDPQTLQYMLRSPEDDRYLADPVLLAGRKLAQDRRRRLLSIRYCVPGRWLGCCLRSRPVYCAGAQD